MAKGSLSNKQNRLDRLVGLLRQNDLSTLVELSRALEVSERTLLRDINELRDQGYPIETERGRGGGVSLNHRWGIDRLRLSNEEIINLLVSLAITETLNSPLLAKHLRSIRQKISQSFPEQQRKMINQLRSRILVGEMASSVVIDTYRPPANLISNVLTDCFFHLEMVDIHYQAESGVKTERRIEPQLLLFNWPVWYLLGWDYLRQAPRMFRVDRIAKAKGGREKFKPRRKSALLEYIEPYFTLL